MRPAPPHVTAAVLGVIGLLGLLAGCSSEAVSDDFDATTTTTEADPGATTSTSNVSSGEGRTNVYWAWSIPSSNGTPEKLGAGGRDLQGPQPARDALEALLDGPNAVEAEIGMGTEIPQGTELLDISVDAGVALVDLTAEFEASGGTLSETMRISQVIFTLTQFDTVDRVLFRIDGSDRPTLGSHGIEVGDGLDRESLPDVRPFILIESPQPGVALPDGFHITGESNTFEGTVQWVVTDAEGLIVADGFTTATDGNGTWGTFDVTPEVPDTLDGRGAIIVFESSAEDGSQRNVVEYPVTF